jgi:hypothetical protein
MEAPDFVERLYLADIGCSGSYVGSVDVKEV